MQEGSLVISRVGHMDRWRKTGRAGGVRDKDGRKRGETTAGGPENGGNEISRGTGRQGEKG